MVQARIYKPSKTAMQSGKAKSNQWVLEFCPNESQFIDPIMGWRGSKDTLRQVRLTFRSLESAIAYAKKINLSIEVVPFHSRLTPPKRYADTFRYDKIG